MRSKGSLPKLYESLGSSVGRLIVAALVTALVYGTLFSYRTDYLGHYLAGMGGTLLLSSPLLARSSRAGWKAVAVTFVAIGLGAVTEATIFKYAIFDPVDFFNQSLGAGVAAAAVLGPAGSPRPVVPVIWLSVLLIGAGFFFAFV